MTTFQSILIALAVFAIFAPLSEYCAKQCTRRDVLAGRRDAMALSDDYGSNRGFYWPWSPLYVLAMLPAALAFGWICLIGIALLAD